MLSTLVDFIFHILLSEHPEQHDSGQACAQGADVDGQQVHPVGDDTLDEQGYHGADAGDDAAGRNSGKSGLFLHCGNGGFVEIHQRGHAGQKYRGEENNRDEPAARHGTDKMGQENE